MDNIKGYENIALSNDRCLCSNCKEEIERGKTLIIFDGVCLCQDCVTSFYRQVKHGIKILELLNKPKVFLTALTKSVRIREEKQTISVRERLFLKFLEQKAIN